MGICFFGHISAIFYSISKFKRSLNSGEGYLSDEHKNHRYHVFFYFCISVPKNGRVRQGGAKGSDLGRQNQINMFTDYVVLLVQLLSWNHVFKNLMPWYITLKFKIQNFLKCLENVMQIAAIPTGDHCETTYSVKIISLA